jgi:hypothetical protein
MRSASSESTVMFGPLSPPRCPEQKFRRVRLRECPQANSLRTPRFHTAHPQHGRSRILAWPLGSRRRGGPQASDVIGIGVFWIVEILRPTLAEPGADVVRFLRRQRRGQRLHRRRASPNGRRTPRRCGFARAEAAWPLSKIGTHGPTQERDAAPWSFNPACITPNNLRAMRHVVGGASDFGCTLPTNMLRRAPWPCR